MIKIENNKISVLFGENGKGSIGLNGSKGKLYIQELLSEINIGERIKQEDVKELPRIELNFKDTKSIDSLITVLNFVKDKMTEIDPNQYAYAC